MLATQVKDPDETRDVALDWSARLAAGEVLAASSWAVDAGVTIVQESYSNSTATARLAGGAAGSRYELTNTVTTSLGRTYNESIDLEVRSL